MERLYHLRKKLWGLPIILYILLLSGHLGTLLYRHLRSA